MGCALKGINASSDSSDRMAIVRATFILAVQEILDLLYFASLFISDQTELNSLVAKNACYTPQGISHNSLCQSRLADAYQMRSLVSLN